MQTKKSDKLTEKREAVGLLHLSVNTFAFPSISRN